MIKILRSLIFITIICCNYAYALEQQTDLIPIDVIFHGSNKKDIKILKPMQEHIRDDKEGALIFATPSIGLASCYMFKWDDSWVYQTIYNNKIIMVISDKPRFTKNDNGGAIYLLPPNNFEYNKNKGLGIYEWTNKEEVKPYTELDFLSSFEAMTRLGVKVCFTNKDQFQFFTNLSEQEQNTFLMNSEVECNGN